MRPAASDHDYTLDCEEPTNLKTTARLLDLVNNKGGRAQVEVAVDVTLLLDGLAVKAANLPGVFVRRLLDIAALLEIAASQGEIINGTGFPSREL